MAVRVRQGRATFRRSWSGEEANQMSSTINAEWQTDIRNKRFEKTAKAAADRVERLNDRAVAFGRATKPLSNRLDALTPELQQRAARVTKSAGAYQTYVTAYKKELTLWEKGKSTKTLAQMQAMYDRQKRAYLNAVGRKTQYTSVKNAYDQVRRSLISAINDQREAAKNAKKAYDDYIKKYGKDAGS